MKKGKILYLTQSALIAALYVALTWLSNLVGLASGAVQIRISEALCVLPAFMPSAIPGLFIGCLISNISMGSNIFDIIFGSLATLIGAVFTSKLKNKFLAPIPAVISNTIIVPIVIMLCYTAKEARNMSTYLLTTLGVFAGEVISAYIFGIILYVALEKRKDIFTKK
ncbi:MAG: QueT transporter family protein [Clostridia bacterium]|nr:QueT transporter family protein [Clostridia bacterium]